MCYSRIVVVLTAAVLVLATSATGQAETILMDPTTQDGSFELDPVGIPAGNLPNADWTYFVPTAGIFGSGVLNPAPSADGEYQVYLQSTISPGVIGQSLEYTMQDGDVFHVSYEWGHHYPGNAENGIKVELLSGDPDTGTVVYSDSSFGPGQTVNWIPHSFDWTATGVSGENLSIRVMSSQANVEYMSVDNIVVTVDSVPEPSTLALLSLGLFGLGLHTWRKRK